MRPIHWAGISILFFCSCAQVREITGGEKDIVGPELLRAIPPNFSTGFTGDRITLQFNERVQVDRGRDRLLVSPPLDAAPEIRISRSSDVIILLKAPLRANTTYTFGIGEVVKDLTEGNPAKSADYVVSTGSVLDSMSIAGGVVNSFKGSPEKGVLVMAYDVADTSTFQLGRPTYATRTNEAGAFKLGHLRSGSYLIRALRDQNANYRYDLPNEEIAFVTDTIHAIDTTARGVPLRLFQERSASQSVREVRALPDGALRVVLAHAAERISVRDVLRSGSVLTWTPEWSATRDTVLLWPSDTTALGDGRYELSTEEGTMDSVRYSRIERWPFFTGLRTAQRDDEKGIRVFIEAARPISKFDLQRFTLTSDSSSVPFTIAQDSTNHRRLVLTPELAIGSGARLTILPKAVHDVYGGANDSLRTSIGRAAEQATGTLRITLTFDVAPQGRIILQLLDGQGRVVREMLDAISGKVVAWKRVAPGNHTLRVIGDANANGRWDTGSLAETVQPERVWHHSEVVNVRAAWDLGVEWKIDRP